MCPTRFLIISAVSAGILNIFVCCPGYARGTTITGIRFPGIVLIVRVGEGIDVCVGSLVISLGSMLAELCFSIPNTIVVAVVRSLAAESR